jgi:hypothetical protein
VLTLYAAALAELRLIDVWLEEHPPIEAVRALIAEGSKLAAPPAAEG